jgi:hypothetical protein
VTARDVLNRAIEAGALILSDAERPYLDGVPAELRPLIEAHRDELRALLARDDEASAPAQPAMPALTHEALAVFAREGAAVGFRAPWCDRVLWWAPSAAEAAKLVAWGIAERGAVRTADELAALIGLAGPDARAVVLAKLDVNGVIHETRVA